MTGHTKRDVALYVVLAAVTVLLFWNMSGHTPDRLAGAASIICPVMEWMRILGKR